MKKKALFLDIDYTLFSPRQGIVPPSAEAAVRKARENGHYVFLCTGRSQAEARKYQNFPVDGFIYANGAACFVKGKNIYDHPISEENVNRIREMIERHHMGVLIGGVFAVISLIFARSACRLLFSADVPPVQPSP